MQLHNFVQRIRHTVSTLVYDVAILAQGMTRWKESPSLQLLVDPMGRINGWMRYRPEHDEKRLQWPRLSSIIVPSTEYAAVKFVFNGAFYRICGGEVCVQWCFLSNMRR